jgi:hypothetical protein
MSEQPLRITATEPDIAPSLHRSTAPTSEGVYVPWEPADWRTMGATLVVIGMTGMLAAAIRVSANMRTLQQKALVSRRERLEAQSGSGSVQLEEAH